MDEQAQTFHQFALLVHRRMTVHDVSYDLANEARRVLRCDRVTIAVVRGRNCRITAVSGVSLPSAQSRTLKRQRRLLEAVARTNETLIHGGQSQSLAPEIEQPLREYLDDSASKHLVVVPLSTNPAGDRKPHAIMLVERFQSVPDADWKQSLTVVTEQASLAMERAVKLNGLPLLNLMLWLEPTFRVFSRGTWLRWCVSGLCLATLIGALLLVKVDHRVLVRGQLVPARRVNVFAPIDGIVEEVAVDYGQRVAVGDPVARMHSAELELEFKRVTGELATARERLNAIHAERLQLTTVSTASRVQAGQLTANELIAKGQIENLERQLEIVNGQQSQSRLASPMVGTVLSWDVRQRLSHRPVRRGQSLLVIADLEGPWKLELKLPDRQAGHVLDAVSEGEEQASQVSFVLETEPQRRYLGKIDRVALASDIDSAGRANLEIDVSVDKDQIDQPRSGAAVAAKFNCGRRSILYVWTYAFVDEIRRRWF